MHSPFTRDPRAVGEYREPIGVAALTGAALNFATMLEGMDRSQGDERKNLSRVGGIAGQVVAFDRLQRPIQPSTTLPGETRRIF